MIGLSYISVPLYQLYCQSFGGTGNPFFGSKNSHQILPHQEKTWYENFCTWNQTAQRNKIAETNILEDKEKISTQIQKSNSNKKKPITIYFNADTSDNLPWNFKPCLQKIKVYPGDTALSFYIAENKTDNAISGISTYNITPSKVGIYFNKIQCFCFEEQRLKSHESIEMPVLFFIDPDFEKDPKMNDVQVINLSYTFFRTD